MKIEDLFPVCSAHDCPKRGAHKHILDHQRAFFDSDAKYVAMIGGYGSAKTLPACALGVMLSLAIPGNIGVVFRRTYIKLHDSTQATFFEVLERGGLLDDAELRENRDGWYHRVVLSNGSTILFRESKDIGRWLGPQFGWFLGDEVVEEPETTFTKLMGRLRLPRAGAYLKGILLTNPPDSQHWVVKWFGEQDGVRAIEDPTTGVITKFQAIYSPTTANIHLPPGYVESLKLLDPNEYQRVVLGQIGITADGPPVYPEFKHTVHVGVPELRPGSPLRRGWDFGFRHPACAWGDVYRCRKGKVHCAVLADHDARQIETEDFARQVMEQTKRLWPSVPPLMVMDAGDHAGTAVNEKGPGPIVRLSRPKEYGGFGLRFRTTPVKDIDPGLDLVRRLLKDGVCACGQPYFVVHRRCRNTIKALAGGYHYPGNKPKDKPVKDGFYDDVADAVRYLVWNFVRPELTTDLVDEIERRSRVEATPARPAWSWMDPQPTPEQVAAEIMRVKEEMRTR